MKPLKLVMSGWGSYPEQVEIDFTRFRKEGLFLITGPTGAGKTTIFDGISYGLFGNVSGKFREKDMIRSDFCSIDTDTFVELHFMHKGEVYSIRRSPKYERAKKRGIGVTTSLETAVFGKDGEPPVTALSEVNRRVEELMGLNYLQFKQIAMIAQGEFIELLFSSSGDRTAILRNLFQTAQYDRLQKNLAERAKGIYRKREELQNRMDEAAAMIECGEAEELGALLKGENYVYETICEKVGELIEEDRKAADHLDEERIQLEEGKREYLLAIQSGKKRNETIDALVAAEEQQEKLKEEIPEIKEKEVRLKQAEAAERVYQEERMYVGSKGRRELIEKKRKELEREKKQLEAEEALCEKEKKMITELEEKAECFEKQYQRLNGFLPSILDLEKVRMQLAEEQKTEKKKQKEAVSLGEQRELMQSIQDSDMDEMNQYSQLEEELGRVQIALAESDHQRKELKNAEKCVEERKELQKELKEWQVKFQKSEKKLEKAKQSYEEKESLYRKAAVGLAAKYLQDNMPCPVCGSLEHPNKAQISSEIPDQEQIEKEKIQLNKIEEEYNSIYRFTATKNGMVQAKDQEWKVIEGRLFSGKYEPCEGENPNEYYEKVEGSLQDTCNALEKKIRKLNKEAKEWVSKKAKREALKIKIEKRNQELMELEKQIRIFENALQESRSRQTVLLQNQESFLFRLPEEYRSEKKVKADMKHLDESSKEQRAMALARKEKREAVKTKMVSILNLEENQKTEWEEAVSEESREEEKFRSILIQQGFAEEAAYRSARRAEEEKQDMGMEIQLFWEKVQRIQIHLEGLRGEVQTKEKCQIAELTSRLKEAEGQEQFLQKQKDALYLRLKGNQKAIAMIKNRLEEKNKLDAEYGIIRDLDKAARGENREKLVFEQFVLGSYFEDILFAANRRFFSMTGGRYELQKVSKVYDARTKDSLDLEVLDHYTGKCRSVKTLSGGEAFKAALSLALGMSDTIQRYAGGIEIDTLFIDEGFGSLDLESLDLALRTITEQSGNGRLIGIISHVAELKERMDQQIIVEKTVMGSKLSLLTQ